METFATYTEKEIKELLLKDLKRRKLTCTSDPKYLIELDPDNTKVEYFVGVQFKVDFNS